MEVTTQPVKNNMAANNTATAVMMRVGGWFMIRVFIICLSFCWLSGRETIQPSPKIVARFYAASICSRRTTCLPKFGDV
jgi:hypothetical protein